MGVMVRAMWDAVDGGGPKKVEGWVNLDNVLAVERAVRDRLGDHAITCVPLARVVMVDGRVATAEGPDAAQVFRACELMTRFMTESRAAG